MDLKKASYATGHRERLRQKFLDDKLVEYELMELLLCYALPRMDVRPLARELINKFGNVYNVITAPIESLTMISGIKTNTAILIKLTHKLMSIGYKDVLKKVPIFHNEKILYEYCMILLNSKTIEELHIFYLDKDYRLLLDDLHSVGTNNASAVYPREILKRAMTLNAKSIVMLHNHPTPNMSFSKEDIAATVEVRDILASLEIDLYDHLLVSGGMIYSMNNMFLIKK